MPGGFARIGDGPDPRAMVMGEGVFSADVCVHGSEPVETMSLLPPTDSLQIRRNPGTLPSRVADNFYWLGRYLERGEALLAAIRVMLGNSIDADGGGALAPETIGKLVGLIVGGGAADHPASLRRADLTAFARAAMEDGTMQSVLAINQHARNIADGSRDRLSPDMVRLLEAPFPTHRGMLDRAGIAPASLRRDCGAQRRTYGSHRCMALPRPGAPDRTRRRDRPRDAVVRDARCEYRRSVDACSTSPTARSAIASVI